MKNFLRTITLLAIFTFIIPISVYADEDGINDISVIANLNADGSADITETWDVDNVYDGTEYYKDFNNLGDMTVSDLTVSDDSGTTYTTVDDWDTSGSFEDKAYKCGILETDDGYEVCWGISEMGDRVYTISYRLTGIVKSYSDSDGFYHRFIADDRSYSLKSASVTVVMDGVSFSTDNAKIWAFGFDGKIDFENGAIVARSDGKLGSNSYMNLLIEFNRGAFSTISDSGSFEDVKNKAMKKAEWDKIELFVILGAIAAICLVGGLLAYILTRHTRLADGTKIRRVPLSKAEPSSTVPFGNNIPAICRAVTLDYGLSVAPSAIASYIVKWQLSGILRFDSRQGQSGKQGKPIIILTGEPDTDPVEKSLFALMQSASKNNQLTLSGWQKWTEKHYKKIEKWQKELKKRGSSQLILSGWAAKDNKDKLRFTASGYEMYVKTLGFYKYLKSFKNPTGDFEAPRDYWGDYLIYASLFNLSNQVTGGLKAVDSSGFDNFCGHYNMNTAMFILYMNHTHSYSSTATTSTAAGGGGSSYSSGGGGFSGGGSSGSR